MKLHKIYLSLFLKIFKIIMVIQIFNVAMNFSMWLSYGYLFSGWTIATLTVFGTLLIYAVKVSIERMSTAPEQTINSN